MGCMHMRTMVRKEGAGRARRSGVVAWWRGAACALETLDTGKY